MIRLSSIFTFILMLLLAGPASTWAQEEPEPANDTDGASQQVEESDEAFRRRMELEDARYRDPGYTDPVDTYKRELEKIDKLPEESRDNIRDQLIDVIMTNGEWEPSDALGEYPYTPTAAAQGDPKLAQQEQEAWEEQVEKYHERESEAFGAYRGPVQGPGNPDGPEGSQGSPGGGQEGGQQGQQGQQGGQQGQQGGQQGDQGEQSEDGTYQPYQSSSGERSDQESRAGVSESALDFLMGRQAGSQGSTQSPGQAGAQASAQPPGQAGSQAQSQTQSQNQAQNQDQAQAQDTAQTQNQQQSQPSDSSSQQTSEQVAQQDSTSQSENSEQSDEPVQQDLRGILAIEDLDKLGVGTGTAPPPPPEEEEDDGDQEP